MKSNTIALISAAVMTGTTEVDSIPLALDQIFGLAVQAIWTGTPNGSIKLQASSDSPSRQTQVSLGQPDVITNWTDIANSSVTIAGSAGNYMWNIDAAFFRYIRVVYVNTSSTGVLNVNVCIKGV